jgi:putative membrane protein
MEPADAGGNFPQSHVLEMMMKVMHAALAAALLSVAPLSLAQSGGPNDAQIAAIVVTANQVDIDAGKLAQSKSANAEVKAFGKQMVTDHTGVNKAATDLVKRLKVKPEDNATAQALKKGGQENVAKLKTLKGAAFDKAYVDHEVDYHQQVIDAIDKTLIPSAQNADLKALLVKVRPAFIAHLDHAKHLQSSLGK